MLLSQVKNESFRTDEEHDSDHDKLKVGTFYLYLLVIQPFGQSFRTSFSKKSWEKSNLINDEFM